MPLPIPALPSGSIDLGGGAVVEYRSLSRAQAMKLQGYKGREDQAEDWIVACGLGITVKEAHAWRDAVPFDVGGRLVDAIIEISGLEKPGDGDDPKG